MECTKNISVWLCFQTSEHVMYGKEIDTSDIIAEGKKYLNKKKKTGREGSKLLQISESNQLKKKKNQTTNENKLKSHSDVHSKRPAENASVPLEPTLV